MSDRFLFRGKIDNKWHYGSLHICRQFNHHHIIGANDSFESDECVEINAVSNSVIEVDPTTIGQCTGLSDNNGKLIFEGDIVRDEYGLEFYVEISQHFQQTRLYPVNEEAKKRFYSGFGIDILSWMYRIEILNWMYPEMELEIIGNIHDNPELLSGLENRGEQTTNGD